MKFKVGEVQEIGGIRVLCVPDYFLTHVGMEPGTIGVLLTPEATESLLKAMREAEIIPPNQDPPRADAPRES